MFQLLISIYLLYGFTDFNNDSKIKVVFVGDSVVKGVNDSRGIGYPGRIQERNPKITVVNLGIAGETSSGMLIRITGLINSNSATIKNTDIVVIDIGRNDYWNGNNPRNTYNNIIRLSNLLKRVSNRVYITTLIPTTRSYQQGFISRLNRLLSPISKIHLANLPLKYVNQVHPTTQGYDVISKMIETSIKY